jgi:hypothetical protein
LYKKYEYKILTNSCVSPNEISSWVRYKPIVQSFLQAVISCILAGGSFVNAVISCILAGASFVLAEAKCILEGGCCIQTGGCCIQAGGSFVNAVISCTQPGGRYVHAVVRKSLFESILQTVSKTINLTQDGRRKTGI